MNFIHVDEKNIDGWTSFMIMTIIMLIVMLVMMLITMLKMMLKICKHDLGLNIRHGVGHDVKDVIHNIFEWQFQ